MLFDFLGIADPEQPPLDLPTELRQRKLFAFIRRLVQARSEREPTVLFLDDLHWIDSGSEVFWRSSSTSCAPRAPCCS